MWRNSDNGVLARSGGHEIIRRRDADGEENHYFSDSKNYFSYSYRANYSMIIKMFSLIQDLMGEGD